MDGQSFRIEGDTLICRKQVDLSDFCFYLGEDVSHKFIVNTKTLNAIEEQSVVTKMLRYLPLLFLLPLLFSKTFPLTPPIVLIALVLNFVLYKHLAPSVKIKCVVSSDGEALRSRSLRKNVPLLFAYTASYAVFVSIGVFVINRLNVRPHYLWVVIPSVPASLAALLLKKGAKASDLKWGPPKAVKLSGGMYRLLDLPTNLVRAYAAKQIDTEESLVKV